MSNNINNDIDDYIHSIFSTIDNKPIETTVGLSTRITRAAKHLNPSGYGMTSVVRVNHSGFNRNKSKSKSKSKSSRAKPKSNKTKYIQLAIDLYLASDVGLHAIMNMSIALTVKLNRLTELGVL